MLRSLLKRSQQPAPGRLFAFGGVRPQRGFTLLELMAVLVIIGIILTFVTLTAGGDKRAEQMGREVQRLAALIEMASDEAVMRSEQFAIRFGEDEYEFMILRDNEWFTVTEDPVLRPRSLPQGVELRLELEENHPEQMTSEDAELPQVFLLSSGEMTPFILTLTASETETKYYLKASLLGRLELE